MKITPNKKRTKSKTDSIFLKNKDFDKINQSIILQNKELKEINKSVIQFKEEIRIISNKTEPTFWGAKYDTLFTVCFTISIFIFGVIIDRGLKNHQEKKELDELRQYFSNQIKELLTVIKKPLIKAYKKFYQETISINNGMPTTPPKLFTNSFHRVLKMESEKLFKSFKSNEKEKFNKYFNEIDFLSNLLNDIEDYHKIALKRSESIRNPIAKIDSEFMKTIAMFCDSNPEHKPFLSKKLNLYYTRISKGRHLRECYKEIVRPVQEYVIKNNIMESGELGYRLGELGKLYSTKYNDLRRLIFEVKCQYRTVAFRIQESFEKIENLS